MSITSALFTGVNGMKAQSEAMGVISNNIANVNTTGYKAARTLFSDLLSQNIGHNNSQVGLGTQVQKVETQFFGGSLQTTANVSDVALQGDNLFFAVANLTATGGPAPVTLPAAAQLTRAGAFNLDALGNLVNPDGKNVLDDAGLGLSYNPATFGRITGIDSTGKITAVDTTGTTILAPVTGSGRIGLVRVQVPTELQKGGGSLYNSSTTSGTPLVYANLAGAGLSPTEKIVANSLESSNVDMAAEMVNMIVTQRAYSANSKTITVNDQLTNDAIQMVR